MIRYLLSLPGRVFTASANMILGVFTATANMVGGILLFPGRVFAATTNMILEVFTATANKILGVFTDVFTATANMILGVLLFPVRVFTVTANMIFGVFAATANKILGVLSFPVRVYDFLVCCLYDAFDRTYNFVFCCLYNLLVGAWSAFCSAFCWIIRACWDAFLFVIGAISYAVRSVVYWLCELPGNVVTILGDFAKDALGVVSNLLAEAKFWTMYLGWHQLCWTLRFVTNLKICVWASCQILGTDLIQNLRRPSYHIARCKEWPKLSRRCGVAYPKTLDITKKPTSLLKYAMRHAMCSYPPRMLVALGELPWNFLLPFKSTSDVLKCCFNIGSQHSQDIVDFDKQQTTNLPSFYLCVDHAEKHIVVSIRGTVPSNVFDVLTDLNAQPMSYSGGEVHRGMALAAKNVLAEIQNSEPARKLLFDPKNMHYDVIFCGHSLGAGVAALMAMRVMNGEASVFSHYVEMKKIQAFAFASPGVASQSLIDPDQITNKKWNQIVTSVALSTDLVTRMSVRSYTTHIERCEFISKWTTEEKDAALGTKKVKICTGYYQGDIADYEGDEQSEDKGAIRDDLLIEGLKEMGESDGQMFPLGEVLWYVPNSIQEKNDGISKLVVADTTPKDADLHWSGVASTAMLYICALADCLFAYSKSKRFDKYNAKQYKLCDATEHKEAIFQNLILDVESLHAHFPNRYLWACGATLIKPSKLDD